MEHGTKSSYDNHGCRCEPCRAAASLWQREYRKKNKAKIAADNKRWREANPGYERSRVRDKAQRAVYNRQYYLDHREVALAQVGEWERANPDKVREKHARRRARKANVPHEPYNRMDIYDRDEGICYLCGEFVPTSTFQIDHLVPIALGGADAEYNVGIAHSSCNAQKGAKIVAKLPRVLTERAMLLGSPSFAPRGRRQHDYR